MCSFPRFGVIAHKTTSVYSASRIDEMDFLL